MVYNFPPGSGFGLNTETTLINPLTQGPLGYCVTGSQPSGIYGGPYLFWGGDNTNSQGSESIYVSVTSLKTAYPTLSSIQLTSKANWLTSFTTGALNITMYAYSGGTMISNTNFGFINVGGVLLTQRNFPQSTITGLNCPNNQCVGTFTYDISSGCFSKIPCIEPTSTPTQTSTPTNTQTQIIALEDVMRYFDFEKQFSMITEGIEVEKKNKDSFYIPYEESPKLLITSNYVIQGTGASHERRRIEIELKQYYKPDFSPRDEFGHNLYDEWSDTEWNLFDNFMMWCVQQYLLHGVAKPVNKNLSLKKLKNVVPEAFIEWFRLKEIIHDEYYELGELCNQFRAIDHDSAKVTNRKISGWIKAYCEYWHWEYFTKTTSNGAHFIINPKK